MANLECKGQFETTTLSKVVYGRGTTSRLPELLESLSASKAFIVTGSSLQTKTPVISQIEEILGDKHVATFSKIGQHAPVEAIREAADQATAAGVDVFISVGGGSPIDSVKGLKLRRFELTVVIIHSLQNKSGGSFIPHIAIPTTLSVAETTAAAGYTSDEGHKVGVAHPRLSPRMIIYDGDIASYTPNRLWLSSGMRAVDHAIEMLYNRRAAETPHRLLSLSACHELFRLLPQSKADPENKDIRQRLQIVAFGTLFSISYGGGLGLSHSMGHALGATYQIPHGITSCLTLAAVLQYKAKTSPAEANQIARLVPFLGLTPKSSDEENALQVADKVAALVEELGLKSTLTEYKVPQTQEEAEAIANRAMHGKKGPDYDAVVEMVKDMF